MLVDLFLDVSRPKIIITVCGDSMCGCNIDDGDVVVAFTDEIPSHGDIAILEYKGKRYIKRIFYCPDNTICCKSESRKKYRDFFVHRDCLTLFIKVIYTVKSNINFKRNQ